MLKKDSLVGGSKSAMGVRYERRQARGTYGFISQLSCRHTARNAFMKNSLFLWRRELGMPVFPLAFPSSLLSAYVFDVMTRHSRGRGLSPR